MDSTSNTRAPSVHWTSVALTHTGLVRQANEDAFCARPEAGLWAVADGLGGHSAGDVASRSVVEGLARLRAQPQLSLMVEFIEHSLLDTHARLLALGAGERTVGSTVVALTIVGAHAAYLWVGDSRLYRYRDGALARLTTDHSKVEEFVERGLLRPENAAGHPQAHLLTRAIGARPELFIDMDVCEVRPGDRFLLCSDGLDKHVANDEIAARCELPEPRAFAEALLDLTLARGAADNVTLCVVDIH
ncbi:MAG: PP2C family serine/threonine-protein phosphatase [Gammaproteobacteria bacterium]